MILVDDIQPKPFNVSDIQRMDQIIPAVRALKLLAGWNDAKKTLCITFRLVLYSFIVIWTSAAMTVVLVDTGLQLQTDAAWRWLCHDYIEPQASCSNTVESSLFGGDQCLWHLWVTLANELTFPRTYTQLFVKYLLKLSRLQNYGRVNFGYPRTLTLTNKNDFTVVVNIRLNVCTYV